MDNNKKPSEPVEEERWALKDVPTGELLKELIRHDDVRILSLHHDQNGVGNIYISSNISPTWPLRLPTRARRPMW